MARADTLVTNEELRRRLSEVAGAIDARYPDGLVVVAVLKGSVIFLADLVRRLHVPVLVDFLAISSYAPDSGRVRIVRDVEVDLAGRDVLLLEDIVDTGLTLAFLLRELGARGPRSLEVCTLLDKRVRRLLPIDLRFVGFEVPDVFVLGYGLDFAGRYRNLDSILAGELELLTTDPDVYVADVYGKLRPPG